MLAEVAIQGERELLAPEHVSALLQLARALSGATEHAELAALAAEQVRVLSGAAATQLAELRGIDRLAVIAQATAATPSDRRTAFSAIDAAGPAQEVLRRGAPVWIGSQTEAHERFRGVPLDALSGCPGAAAWAFLPLVADDRLAGVLTLVFDELRELDPATRAFLVEMASECANALARGSLFTRQRARADASDKARAAAEARQRRSERLVGERSHLFERERFARARAESDAVFAVHAADDMERAQRLTGALALAATERDVIAAITTHGPDAFGAIRLTLLRPGTAGDLEITASTESPAFVGPAGSPPSSDGSWAEAEVFRTGTPCWQDARELARRFPSTWAALAPVDGGSWLGVPVRRAGAVCGVLAVAFKRDRAFTVEARERLSLLAAHCASVLSARIESDSAAAQVTATARREERIAHVAEYEERGRDGLEAHVLGVFSSEATARDAVRELCQRRAGVVRAWLTCWIVDVPRQRTRFDLLPAQPPSRAS